MATIDEAGAALKTLQEYLTEVKDGYRDIDPGWNVEPESPDGQAIAIWCELLADLDEAVIAAYRSVDPNTAVGQQLDRIARISGLERQAATASTATVTFTGADGTLVPEGTEVRHDDTDTIWETDEDATVSGSTVSVGVTCQTLGPESAGVGDLSIIATPVAGISSVTNSSAASLGRAQESDALLRARRNNSVARLGRNQVGSMFGEVANVDQVKHVRIYENFTGSVDANGLEAHSIAAFVDGGDTVEVAEAIAANKNPGTALNAGSGFANLVQETVETEEGATPTISFFRPVLLDIYVDVTVTGDLTSGIETDIKQAIVDYANAALFSASVGGFDRVGFTIGDVVPAGKLYTPVNRVVGEDGYAVDIKLGESAGNVTSTLIGTEFNELPVFDTSNIDVTIQ